MPRAVGKVFKKRKRVFISTPKCRDVRLEEVEDSINNSTCEEQTSLLVLNLFSQTSSRQSSIACTHQALDPIKTRISKTTITVVNVRAFTDWLITVSMVNRSQYECTTMHNVYLVNHLIHCSSNALPIQYAVHTLPWRQITHNAFNPPIYQPLLQPSPPPPLSHCLFNSYLWQCDSNS
ncbi:hypothetical protein J6590_075679 [Homalodisca vitripennis]|nr:hypothetical protein J6590_075679 [Homalodisca vitripennis]